MRRFAAIGLFAGPLLLPALAGCGERPRAAVDEAAAFGALLGELAEGIRSMPPPPGETPDEPMETFVVEREPAAPFPDHLALADGARWALFRQRLPSARRDTYEHFWARNRTPSVPAFARAGPVRVVVEEIGPNWRFFAEDHPRSVLVCLSAMGFSRDGRQGLVYVVFPGCLGAYYLVGLEGDRWRITGEWEIWVS